ncbi:MAG: N-acetylmuramoyl-L-alanine amidase [Solirubrobacteraceae bacterium]
MDSPGLTRRSLLAAGALLAADGLVRPHGALARLAGPPFAHLAGLTLANSGLQAGPGQPPIIARSVWAQGGAPPAVAPEYGSVKLAFVHHTENPDGYSAAAVPGMLRSIYEFHRFGRGWNDIGYNFVIDRFGRIWEARAGGIDEPVIGAQAGGYNAYSTGISILGTYSAQRISAAALAALEHLIAWKLSLHGAPCEGHVTVKVTPKGAVYSRFPAGARVSLPRVAGHRDADSTDCPGDALYGELTSARHAAAALAVSPSRMILQPLLGEGGAASGVIGSLGRLAGQPLVGAAVAIQQRVVSHKGQTVLERTVAQAATDGAGRFQVPLTLTRAHGQATALRAVFAGAQGAGACVSDPLELVGRASFAAQPAPASPPSGEGAAPHAA